MFDILRLIEKSENKTLADFVYPKKYSDNEGKRMREVMDFTIHHYDKNINLNEIASKANMTPNAFCRYFKQRTNKTYIQFLNELRLEHACKLLLSNKDLSISEIAEKSGFNNISNFNRQFKIVKQLSPTAFKKNSSL